MHEFQRKFARVSKFLIHIWPTYFELIQISNPTLSSSYANSKNTSIPTKSKCPDIIHSSHHLLSLTSHAFSLLSFISHAFSHLSHPLCLSLRCSLLSLMPSHLPTPLISLEHPLISLMPHLISSQMSHAPSKGEEDL